MECKISAAPSGPALSRQRQHFSEGQKINFLIFCSKPGKKNLTKTPVSYFYYFLNLMHWLDHVRLYLCTIFPVSNLCNQVMHTPKHRNLKCIHLLVSRGIQHSHLSNVAFPLHGEAGLCIMLGVVHCLSSKHTWRVNFTKMYFILTINILQIIIVFSLSEEEEWISASYTDSNLFLPSLCLAIHSYIPMLWSSFFLILIR